MAELNPAAYNSVLSGIQNKNFPNVGSIVVGASNGRTLSQELVKVVQLNSPNQGNHIVLDSSGVPTSIQFSSLVSSYTDPRQQPIAEQLNALSGRIVGPSSQFVDTGTIGRWFISNGASDGTFSGPSFGNANLLAAIDVNPFYNWLVVGGQFTTVGGVNSRSIARLTENGTRDAGFACQIYSSTTLDTSGVVYAIKHDTSGKIYVGGSFKRVNSTNRDNLVRLNTDGSVDTTFVSQINSSGSIEVIERQSDGKILIGGSFSTFTTSSGTVNMNGFVRLNSDGSYDSTIADLGINGTVYAIHEMSDGSILIGGSFTTPFLGSNLLRINSNGSPDLTYQIALQNDVLSSYIYGISSLGDGTIILSGNFTSVNNTTIRKLAFMAPGIRPPVVDTDYLVGSDARQISAVYRLMRLSDGKIFIGGELSTNRQAQLRPVLTARTDLSGSEGKNFRWNNITSIPAVMGSRSATLSIPSSAPGLHYVVDGAIFVYQTTAPIGSMYTIRKTTQTDAYVTTSNFLAGTGVTIHSTFGTFANNTYGPRLRNGGSVAHLILIDTNTWLLFGDIVI